MCGLRTATGKKVDTLQDEKEMMNQEGVFMGVWRLKKMTKTRWVKVVKVRSKSATGLTVKTLRPKM